MESITSENEMFFGNVLEQLASAALLDVSTLESIAADIDSKLESLQSRVANSEANVRVVAPVASDSKFSCESHCESDPLALNCFLTNVVQALECNQGLEHAILRELLSFCSRNGFLLPSVDSFSMRDPEGSAASLNTISGESEEQKEELWNKIKSKVKIAIAERMQQSTLPNRADFDTPRYQKEIMQRVQMIDLLMAIIPDSEILELYSKTRKIQLEMYLSGAKKYSVSWADEENIDKVKMVENLETFVVTQLDMLNMDIPVLWKINEYLLTFDIHFFIEDVYLPHLLNAVAKVIRYFGDNSTDKKQSTQLMVSFEREVKPNMISSLDDVRFIAKTFAILWNWENEVAEIVEYFAVKPERRLSGEGLRSVLKSPTVSPSSSRPEGLDNIIWDEDKDKIKMGAETKWPWRDQFKCVISTLSSFLNKNLPTASSLLDLKEIEDMVQLVKIHDKLIFGNTKYPQKIPKFYAKIITLFDELITLASIGGGALFEPVKNAFVGGVTAFLRESHKILKDTLESFSETNNVESLYAVICTASFIFHHLCFYEDCMANNAKKPFRHLIGMFSDLTESAKTVVITYHLKTLMTSILFDAQSNNWLDNKPFFEDERYSFCIQMWSYYMNCLYADTWNKLPQKECKQILQAILSESLTLLTGRYAKIMPSEARTKQYRADVSAICDVSTWLIWKLSSSYKDIFCSEMASSQIQNCHSMCSNMIVNMILVSAPLKQIADYLTNDVSSQQPNHRKFVPERLLFSWSEPALFSKPVDSLNEMDGREAVFFVFKSIVSQAYPSWPLVCQSVLMRDALLPTLIASNADEFIQNSSLPATFGPNENYLNSNFVEQEEIEPSSLDMEVFFRHVYYLLFKSSAKSDALAHFLMALANRENTWGLFDNHVVMKSKGTYETPVWLRNVEKTLIPFLSRSFLPALEMICEIDRRKCQPKFAFTNLEMLPCGCATVIEDNSSMTSSEGELLYQCLATTLNVFTENLNTIPRIIAVFFNRLNEYFYQRHFSAATKSPGLKVLAFISYKWLTVQDNISQLFDFTITSSTMAQIKHFAELVWHLLFNLTTDVSQNPSIPSEILSYVKSNKTWLQEKLKMLTTYFKASVAKSCSSSIDQLPDDLAESQYITLTSALMTSPEGQESLKAVYEILKANQDKIGEKLLSKRSSSCEWRICLQKNDVEEEKNLLNPLVQYEKFGDFLHDQAKTIETEPDWSKWLHVMNFLPNPVLRRKILGRQEFLPDSYDYLTDEEKIAHEKLLRHFEDHTSPLSDRPLSGSSSSTRSSATESA